MLLLCGSGPTQGSLSGFTTSSLAYSGSRPFTLPPPGREHAELLGWGCTAQANARKINGRFTRMLCRYGHEFFDRPVREVLEAVLNFLQQLDGGILGWLLIYLIWPIDSQEFRSLVHAGTGNIKDSSLRTVTRLSLNGGELQNVMHALSRRSTQGFQPQGNHSQQQSQLLPSVPPNTSRDRSGQRQVRISAAFFFYLIPTHNGLPVCRRYLSAMECSSGSSTRCAFGSRAHIAPATLDARVKGHIIQRI
ncbi:hypothetical protein PHMEG_00028775 [Phytophthora megakarya]|uniref:Uncharacterized protein n=1 Tax=Phytophthora megakarya TaxID=4795 RepID=A0A225V3P2_9STRA|nr:hypothetical protein PHMEG_00028775 [Phytophthora megakarya]